MTGGRRLGGWREGKKESREGGDGEKSSRQPYGTVVTLAPGRGRCRCRALSPKIAANGFFRLRECTQFSLSSSVNVPGARGRDRDTLAQIYYVSFFEERCARIVMN